MRVPEVEVDVFWCLFKHSFEVVASPLQRMLDGIGKVLERADGNGLLRRVLRGRVGFGQKWENNLDDVRRQLLKCCPYLGVALGAKSSRLQKWFAKEYAATVHVLTRLNVVESVGHTIEITVAH